MSNKRQIQYGYYEYNICKKNLNIIYIITNEKVK